MDILEIYKRYRISIKIKKIKLKMGISFKKLSQLIGCSRQYIYGVQEMTIKPNKEFIKRLNKIDK